ncbi:MAG TPA: hypothetical protein VED87_05575 [Methylocystis sp.]|nr:hypothetical protein [Methylocystis sp.]
MPALSRAAFSCALALSVTVAFAAPSGKATRVAFKSDAPEAAVKGRVKGAAAADYVFPAKNGETLTVNLKTEQSGLSFTLLSPQGAQMTSQATEYRGVAPVDGDYKISVQQPRVEGAPAPTGGAFTLTIGHEARTVADPAEAPPQ